MKSCGLPLIEFETIGVDVSIISPLVFTHILLYFNKIGINEQCCMQNGGEMIMISVLETILWIYRIITV